MMKGPLARGLRLYRAHREPISKNLTPVPPTLAGERPELHHIARCQHGRTPASSAASCMQQRGRSCGRSFLDPLATWPSSVLWSGAMLSLQPSPDPPSAWLAVVTVLGLPIALWSYKCLMMVLFQRKIIYMGYVPPGARKEQLRVDVPIPKGVQCEEISLQSEKRTMLYGLVLQNEDVNTSCREPDVVIVYLQGNASNPLARIPVFERLLSAKALGRLEPIEPKEKLNMAVIAVAPRSFWKSSSRTPTQRGLLADYAHVLSYAASRYPHSSIVLYGHSLGGSIAVCLAAQLNSANYPTVRGMILENPFSSIPDMVRALYPQRWMPYRYLAPMAFDKWDAVAAMRSTKDRLDALLARLSANMLMLLSEKDEVVPMSMGAELYDASETDQKGSRDDGLSVKRRVIIRGALHENAWTERQWRDEMLGYLCSVHRTAQNALHTTR